MTPGGSRPLPPAAWFELERSEVVNVFVVREASMSACQRSLARLESHDLQTWPRPEPLFLKSSSGFVCSRRRHVRRSSAPVLFFFDMCGIQINDARRLRPGKF